MDKEKKSKDIENIIIDKFKKELKDNYIKALIQGQEIFAQTILDYINNKKTIEDIKNFCESALKSSKTIEKIALKEKENKQ